MTEECPFYDRIGAHCAKPALYLCRARAASSDYRTARSSAHADRYLSGHPDPRDRRGLELHGPAAGPDGRAHDLAVPARVDDDGQRHRTHRGELLQRHRPVSYTHLRAHET